MDEKVSVSVSCKVAYIVFLVISVGIAPGIQNHPTDLVVSRIQSEWDGSYPIRFVFMGDSRNSFYSSDPSADSIFAIERAQINSLAPLFVIHGGDFRKHGYRDEYYDFVARIDSFTVNFLTVRGNHELYADEGPWMYDSIFGDSDYCFDVGIYRFVILADCEQDSEVDYYGHHYINYLLTEEQIRWLDSVLTEADSLGMYELVFAHVPPYVPDHCTDHCLGDPNYYPQPNYTLSHTGEFSTVLSNHRVRVGCWSHRHFYDRSEYMGITYIISGGGGAPIGSAISPPPYGLSDYHFVLFELDADGGITGYVYPAGWDHPDSEYTFTIAPLGITDERPSAPAVFSAFDGNLLSSVRYGSPVAVSLYSLDGKFVISERLPGISVGANKLSLPDGIPAGLYFLSLFGKDIAWRGKMIYLH